MMRTPEDTDLSESFARPTGMATKVHPKDTANILMNVAEAQQRGSFGGNKSGDAEFLVWNSWNPQVHPKKKNQRSMLGSKCIHTD